MSFSTPSPLAHRRIELGLTQQEMARLLGMSAGNLSRVETGEIIGAKVELRRLVAKHYRLSRRSVDAIFDARTGRRVEPDGGGVSVRHV